MKRQLGRRKTTAQGGISSILEGATAGTTLASFYIAEDAEIGFVYRKRQDGNGDAETRTDPMAGAEAASCITSRDAGQRDFRDEQVALKSDDMDRHASPKTRHNGSIKLRRSSSKISRRSSMALLRGKRASSVIGGNLVLPHPSVPCAEFHTLISSELPGPHRLRQLLIWTLQDLRLKNKENPNVSSDAEAQLIDAAIEGLAKKDILTSWYQRPIDHADEAEEQQRLHLHKERLLSSPGTQPLLPNPRNVEIRRALGIYEAFRERIEREKATWATLLDRATTIAQMERVSEEEAYQAFQPAFKDFLADTDADLQRLFGTLKDQECWLTAFQFKGDLLATTLTRSANFGKHAKYFCENLFKSIYYKFIVEKEKKMGALSLAPQKLDTIQLLRALSRTN